MSAPAIEFRNVTYAYPDASSPAVEGLSFAIQAGERVGVLGPNGGGKSTLLKLALGALRGYSGEIMIFGETPERALQRARLGTPEDVPPALRATLNP